MYHVQVENSVIFLPVKWNPQAFLCGLSVHPLRNRTNVRIESFSEQSRIITQTTADISQERSYFGNDVDCVHQFRFPLSYLEQRTNATISKPLLNVQSINKSFECGRSFTRISRPFLHCVPRRRHRWRNTTREMPFSKHPSRSL